MRWGFFLTLERKSIHFSFYCFRKGIRNIFTFWTFLTFKIRETRVACHDKTLYCHKKRYIPREYIFYLLKRTKYCPHIPHAETLLKIFSLTCYIFWKHSTFIILKTLCLLLNTFNLWIRSATVKEQKIQLSFLRSSWYYQVLKVLFKIKKWENFHVIFCHSIVIMFWVALIFYL